MIVSWIGVVVTRCDQFGWYSDGSCRGSCDWAVAGEAVTGLFLLLVKVVCLCILRVLDWRFDSGISGKRSCVATNAGRGEGC